MLYSLKSRINSRETTSRIAARITANCEPIPPSTTIASTKADSAKVKFRADEATARGEQRAGEASKRGADGKGGQLDARRAQAQRTTGDLIFTQRFPRPAQRHSQQAVDDEQAEHYQQQRHRAEENHPVGGIVFDAEEVAEGIPAAFAGAAAKFEAKEGRFRDLADAVRPAGDLGIVEQQNAHDLAEA